MKGIKNIILIIFLSPFFLHAQETANQFDANGNRHGLWKKTYENGQVRYSGTFNHGNEVGTFNYFNENNPKYPTIVKKFKNGIAEVFFYSEKGILESKGEMQARKRIGQWIYYGRDGKTVISEEHYLDGELDGQVVTYYSNGKPTEIFNYEKGKVHGLVQRFSNEGVLLDAVNYEDGKRNGMAKYYNTRGELLYSGMYANDLKIGTWEYTKEGKRDKVNER